MHKIKNKITVIMAFALFVSCFNMNVFADEVDDTFVIADFASEDMYDETGGNRFTIEGLGYRLAKSTDQSLSGDFSGRWGIDGNGSGFLLYLDETKTEYTGIDFTPYNCVNLWIYNGEEIDAEKTFWIVLQSYPLAWGNRASVCVKRDWQGWKKFTFHFDEFDAKGAFDWSAVSVINFKRETEGGTAGDSGYWAEVYFDRMWLSNDNPGYIVMDMREPYLSKIKARDNGAIAFAADDSVDGLLGHAGRWLEDREENGPTVFWNNADSPTDLSAFSHINFAIYSNGPGTGENLRDIRFYGYQDSNWVQYSVKPDWVGRQFFSVPLESFSLGGSSPEFDWSKTKGLRVTSPVPNDNIIHFDRISFSTSAPEVFAATAFSIENNSRGVPVGTKTVTIEFANRLSEHMAEDAVTITGNGEEIENFHFASMGKDVEIIFSDDLDVSTEYEITVSDIYDIYGQQLEEPVSLKFITERPAGQQQFVVDVNESETVDEVLSLINETGYGADFNMDDENEELSNHIVTVLYEQKPYDDYDAIMEMSKKALSILEELNGCDIVSITAFLEDNKDFVLFGVSEYEDYKKLSARERNEVNKEFITDEDYLSFTALRTNFIAAVKNALSDEEEDTDHTTTVTRPSGNGGSSGGGRTNYLTVVPEPAKEDETGDEKTEETTQEPAFEEYFTDLGEVEWAKAAVNSMLEKGVISKDETKLFRPNDNVTRAEFVKILVMALDIQNETAQCSLSDISESDWYYPYVAAAYSRGIVLGDNENRFGAEEFITRQDAAVMVYRAVDALNETLEETKSSVVFDDASEIDSYAYEAVEKMAKAEIINGMGNNTFSPKSFTSRAQAVKIIYELTQKMKGAVL